MTERQLRTFMARHRVTDTGCWEWTGPLKPNGYAEMGSGKRSKAAYAHRVSYEHFVAPIPKGLQIDHLCRNRACVNPKHLEPVTARENSLRSYAPNMIAHRANVCRKGHEMTPENTLSFARGTRKCRICRNATARAWAAKQRASHHQPP